MFPVNNFIQPTYKEFIEKLKKIGVKVKRDFTVFTPMKRFPSKAVELNNIDAMQVKRIFLSYDPDEKVSKFVIRSVCNRLGIDPIKLGYNIV